MAEEIDTQLFFEWMEFWKEEPFGMDWHRTGLAAYVALASAGGKPPLTLWPSSCQATIQLLP
jgi:hypothetical protein